jgi:hypothetical protein
VNELTLANAATGGAPVLSATGGDTNIGIGLTPKGTGGVVFPAGAVGTPSITTTGDTNTGIFFPAADTIAFSEGGTEAMRLDSAGNMGLGVTPSAWWTGTSAWRAMNLGQGASLSSRASTEIMYLSSNWYFDGTEKYIATGNATQYVQNAGQHIWKTAASGTAGNTISFTQAMTLDASGNLGIGATANLTAKLNFPSADSGEVINIYSNSVESGRSGIGKYSGETRYYCGSGDIFTWVNGGPSGTERARITSGGDLLVGRISLVDFEKFGVEFDTATANGALFRSSSSTAGNMIIFRTASGQIGSITTNGTSSTAYNTSSDYRLKENVAPMTGALAKVAALKPVTYKWKVDGSDGEGFIAHELAEVVTQCVTGEKDAVNEDGSIKPQGIDTSFLVATLTAAIQELKVIVDAQAVEIAALKGTA